MRQTPLTERIEQIRSEIDAFIDKRVAAEKKLYPGLPVDTLRGMMTSRAAGCHCKQFMNIVEKEDSAA
jgi:hypothetical protein